MVRIRLRRVGAKKQPSYRVVVADSRAPRDGRFIETIGHYNPRTDPPTVTIHEDRALYWLSVGAQPSEPVAHFFERLGLDAKLKAVHGGARIEEVAAPRPGAGGAKAVAAPAKDAVAPEAVAAEAVAAEAVAGEAVAGEPVAAAAPEAPAAAEAVAAAAPEAPAAAAGEPAGPADVPVEELGLSVRVAKALEGAGLTSASQIAAKLAEGDAAVLELPGIGPKALDEIRAQLAGHGWPVA